MKKGVLYTILGVLAAAVAFIYYYVTLPAINIHSSGFWFFIMAAIVAVMVVYTIRKAGKDMAGTGGVALRFSLKEHKPLKFLGILLLLLLAAYVIGSILSSPIVNAKKYQQLFNVGNPEFYG